jgi:hypothetical protein
VGAIGEILATDAVPGPGNGAETRRADIALAAQAGAVGPILNPFQRQADVLHSVEGRLHPANRQIAFGSLLDSVYVVGSMLDGNFVARGAMILHLGQEHLENSLKSLNFGLFHRTNDVAGAQPTYFFTAISPFAYGNAEGGHSILGIPAANAQ